MPYTIVTGKNGMYSIENTITGRTFSKHTTLAHALAQFRILLALEEKYKMPR
jgi:hypothetical protein